MVGVKNTVELYRTQALGPSGCSNVLICDYAFRHPAPNLKPCVGAGAVVECK